jgi:hypothetical protein
MSETKAAAEALAERSPPAAESCAEREQALRLRALERELEALRAEMAGLRKIVRGNGESGLWGLVQLHSERIAVLQGQWKWIIGILVMLALAVTQALLRN